MNYLRILNNYTLLLSTYVICPLLMEIKEKYFMKIKNLFSFMRRNKDHDLTPDERMINHCPGAILEDLCSSEKELVSAD